MTSRTLTQATKDLIAAKARIEDPENWCQHHFTVNERVCAVQAVDDTAPLSRANLAIMFLRKAARELFELFPAEVNDYLGHPAVMRMYDRAIQDSMKAAPPPEVIDG